MMQISDSDLQRIREARLRLQRMTLEAQLADLDLQDLMLKIEVRYGLVGKEAMLDIETGMVSFPEEDTEET